MLTYTKNGYAHTFDLEVRDDRLFVYATAQSGPNKTVVGLELSPQHGHVESLVLASMLPTMPVAFEYVNYRGEHGQRLASLHRFYYGATAFHTEQWMVHAYDEDKGEWRDFAVADMTL